MARNTTDNPSADTVLVGTMPAFDYLHYRPWEEAPAELSPYEQWALDIEAACAAEIAAEMERTCDVFFDALCDGFIGNDEEEEDEYYDFFTADEVTQRSRYELGRIADLLDDLPKNFWQIQGIILGFLGWAIEIEEYYDENLYEASQAFDEAIWAIRTLTGFTSIFTSLAEIHAKIRASS